MKSYKNLIWLHLSVLAVWIIPFGGIIGPLLVYNLKKDPEIKGSMANIVNFQIVWLIIVFISLIGFFYYQAVNYLSKSEELQPGAFLFVIAGILLFNLLYPIIVGIMINKTKKIKLYYPTLIRFIK